MIVTQVEGGVHVSVYDEIGSDVKDVLRYDSYLHPKDPVKMKKCRDIKYATTMKAWEEEAK